MTDLERGDIVTAKVNNVVEEWEVTSIDPESWLAVGLMRVQTRGDGWPSFTTMKVPVTAVRFVRKGGPPKFTIPAENITVRRLSAEEFAQYVGETPVPQGEQ